MKMQTKQKTILVTSGPTREPIDPVRFISNYSTGIMGHTIAEEALRRGYRVIYITGPTGLDHPQGAEVICIETARELDAAVRKAYAHADCVIMASAVGDYRGEKMLLRKMSSQEPVRMLRLVKNPDILANLGKKKGKRVLVGFALQTHDLMACAQKKLRNKNLDCIVANKINKKGPSPFGAGRTDLTLIFSDGKKEKYARISKRKFAGILLDKIKTLMLGSKDL